MPDPSKAIDALRLAKPEPPRYHNGPVSLNPAPQRWTSSCTRSRPAANEAMAARLPGSPAPPTARRNRYQEVPRLHDRLHLRKPDRAHQHSCVAPRSCRIFLSRLAASGLIERIEDSPPRWRPLVTRAEFADGAVRAATQLRKSATT